MSAIARRHGSWMLLLCLVVAGSIVQPMPARSLTPEEEALHAELRALKDRAAAALNRRDIDAVLAETDPNVVFTAMDSEVAHGRDAVRKYFERMMTSDSRVVQDIQSTFEPDDLSVVYGGDNAVASGSAKTHFKLVAGSELDLDGRWTADLVKEDGRWLIAAFHYSVNMFDNPLLNAARRMTWYVGIGAALVALLVGYVAGRRLKRPGFAQT
jgi:uncharacterized protein (TIGR02246 family)